MSSGPTEAEFEAALRVVTDYLTAREDSDESASTAHEPAVSEGEERATPAGASDTTAVPAATGLSVDGNVDAVSYTGDGENLLNVATDAELGTHDHLGGDGAVVLHSSLGSVGSSDHHTPTVDTTCNAAACDGSNFTNLPWANLVGVPSGFADGVDDDTRNTYRAGIGLKLSGDTFSLVNEPVLTPKDHSYATIDVIGDLPTTSITLGVDGFPVVAYYSSSELKVAKCNDAVCSPMTLSSSTVDGIISNVGRYASITLAADGQPMVSYHDASNGHLKVAKCNDPACQGPADITEVDQGGAAVVGWHTSITLGADGLPVVSYFDASNGDLKVAKCHDSPCGHSDWTLSVVGGALPHQSWDWGSYSSITLGADGLPVVSSYNETLGALSVVKCNDPACEGGDEILTPLDSDPAGNVGLATSITLGADGLPVISYVLEGPSGEGDLRVAKCLDAACSGATVSTVDDSDGVGQHTSITLGLDGLPVVSYYHATNRELRVAKCGDAACSSASLATVDGRVDMAAGKHTSITLGADGLPVVSYYDEENGLLKVARCGSPFCVPYLRRR